MVDKLVRRDMLQKAQDGVDYANLEQLVKDTVHQLDRDLRREYEIALASAPELERKETNVRLFLISENYDPLRTATRLACYWKARRYIFGDRWLLPMVQTGHGALSMEDIELIRTGFMVVLPRLRTGSPIYIMDESRLPRDPGWTPLRFQFYLHAIYGHLPVNLQTGPTILHVVTSAPRPAININPEIWEIAKTALPGTCVLPKVIVAQAYENPARQHLIDFLAYKTARVAQFRTKSAVQHVQADSFMATRQKLLLEQGLEQSIVPSCLGGDFDYSVFDAWVRQRLSIENAISAGPLQPGPRVENGDDKGVSTKPLNKKARHALIQRKSYNETKERLETLQSTYVKLGLANHALRLDNARLAKLLQRAEHLVVQQTAEVDQQVIQD